MAQKVFNKFEAVLQDRMRDAFGEDLYWKHLVPSLHSVQHNGGVENLTDAQRKLVRQEYDTVAMLTRRTHPAHSHVLT